MRDLAQAVAFQEWAEVNGNEQASAQTMISMLMSVGLSAIATYYLGFIGPFVGSLAASLLNQYVMQPYVYPLLYSESERQAQQRLADNQNALMLTQVPAPTLVQKLGGAGGNEAPDGVFRYYKDAYQGYEVPVLGNFMRAPSGLAPESGGEMVIVNGRIWLPELHALQFLDPGEFMGLIWSYIQDPFKLAEYGATEEKMGTTAEAHAFRYEAFVDQQEVLTQAYEKVLGCAPATHVILCPTRQGGRPAYIAMVDDTRETGGMSRFWNTSSPLVNIADRNMVAYTAKFSAFMGTSLEVALAQLSLTVATMIVQMELTAWVTAEVGTYKPMKTSGGTVLSAQVVGTMGRNGFSNLWQELLSEIFIEEFFLHSAGNALERAIQRGGPLGNTGTEQLLLGWTLGDCLEWAEAFLLMQHNYRKWSKQQAQLDAEDTLQKYVAEHPGETPDLETILAFFPQLAQRVVAKAFDAGKFDEAKFQQVLKEGSALSWHQRRVLSRVVYDEFITQNNVQDVACRRECQRYVKQLLAGDDVSIGNVVDRLTQHMTSEGFLTPTSYFKLEFKFHGVEDAIVIDPHDPTSDYETFKNLPFTALLDNPNIEGIAFIDPQAKLRYDDTKMDRSIPDYKKLRNSATSQLTPDDLNQLGRHRYFAPDKTKVPSLEFRQVIEELTGEHFHAGNYLTEAMVTKLYKIGIRFAYDIAYIVAHRHKININEVKTATAGGTSLIVYGESYNFIQKLTNPEANPQNKPLYLFSPCDLNPEGYQNSVNTIWSSFVCKELCEVGGIESFLQMVGDDVMSATINSRDIEGLQIDGIVETKFGEYLIEDKFITKKGKFQTEFNNKYFDNYNRRMEAYRRVTGAYPKGYIFATFDENLEYFQGHLMTDAYDARVGLAASLKQDYHVTGVVVDNALVAEFGKDFVVIRGTYVSPNTGERVENFELCFERTASIVTYAKRAIEMFKGLVPNADKIADLTVENLLEFWGFEYKNNRWWWVYKN